MTWADRYLTPSAQALYLHVPFCVRKCAYCDFASWGARRDDPALHRYAQALISQVGQAQGLGLLDGCRTAYIGGGTPTLLGDDLVALVAAMRAACPDLVELTSEANPDSLSQDLVFRLVDAGLTRLSVGVQSTDDRELKALGRIHTAEQAGHRVREAVAVGLDVSCDLMCAIPLQTEFSWARSLQDVASWGAGHVSVYPLQIEDGTPLAAQVGEDDPAWNSPDVQADRMEQAASFLAAQGFYRYEVASYARPGKECLHNQAYWTGRSYLGLGTGAASMLSLAAYERLREAAARLPELGPSETRVRLRIQDGRSNLGLKFPAAQLELEVLTEAQAASEDLMLSMRMDAGVGPRELSWASGILGPKRVSACFDHLISEGLAARKASAASGERLAPTHKGWLLGNELYGALWDLAPTQETRFLEVLP